MSFAVHLGEEGLTGLGRTGLGRTCLGRTSAASKITYHDYQQQPSSQQRPTARTL